MGSQGVGDDKKGGKGQMLQESEGGGCHVWRVLRKVKRKTEDIV